MSSLLLGFFTILAPQRERSAAGFAHIGRWLWLAGPVSDALLTAAAALCGLACLRTVGLPGVAAVLFVCIDHLLRGFRPLDGFADLSEAILFALGRPSGQREAAWRVLRSPATGPYGVTALALLLLLEWSVLCALLQRGAGTFVGSVLFAQVASRLASTWAIARPQVVKTDSDFGPLAGQAANPRRLLALGLVSLLLMFPFAAWVYSQLWPRVAIGTLAAGGLAILAGSLARACTVATLGWINGDLLGFTSTLVRALTLTVILATLRLQ
jgi:adenosylcobinamide-GDP ribazoletransferase